MKKFLLLMMMFATSWSLMAQSALSASELQSSAIDFDWVNGNEQTAADGTKWYKVDLSNVNQDENLLLYLNNLATVDADVTVRAAFIVNNTVQIIDDATQTKTIAPNHNYAKEFSHSLFTRVSVVYVELTTTQLIRLAAEPVEPGEKVLDCLNAAMFNRSGTTHAAGAKAWYKVELNDVIADATKSFEITVKNTGSGTASVKAGLSMDCPSTGTTDRLMTFAPGESQTVTLKRSYIDIVGPDGMVYVYVESDQSLLISAAVVAAPVPTETYTVTGAVDVALDQLYTMGAGETQWYRITLADVDVARTQPEVSVENKGTTTANIAGVLIYANPGDALTDVPATATRTLTIAGGEAWIKAVTRNMTEAAAAKYAYAYVRLTTNNPIEFIARLKSRLAGTQCLKAVGFDWTNGNVQSGNSTVWYAVPLQEAKAATNKQKNIKLTVINLSNDAASATAQVATVCPCDATQDISRNIPAKDSVSTVIKYSTYSAMANDTVWVGVTTDQNVHIKLRLVPSEFNDTITACASAIDFDWDNGNAQTLDPGATLDTAWYAVPIYEIVSRAQSNKQVPEITVTNLGAATAHIVAEMSFECPVVTEMEKRTVSIAAGGEYVKAPTLDLIESIDSRYDSIYIRVITDQPIHISAEFKYENEGKGCSTAEQFNWTLGQAKYNAADAYWYAVDISNARNNEQDILLTLVNDNAEAVTVNVGVTTECPVVSGLTEYSYTIAANSTKEKKITYATLVGVGADVVYISVKAAKDLTLKAETQGDPTPETDICDGSIAFVDFDWENGHVQEAGTVWYRVKLDTLRSDLVPTVVVENLGTGATTVRGEVAFKCNVKLNSMMGKTITLNGAGDTWERQAKKSMMSMIDSTMQYAYIRVEASDSIRFNGGMVNPNVGNDCYSAIDFDWDNGNIHTAGDTLWYKVDLTRVTGQPNKAAVLGIKNLDGWKGDVTADFFFTCDDTIPFESYTYTLAGSRQRELEFARETFTSLAVDNILIRLYAAQQDSIYARLIDVEAPVLPVVACDSAIEAQLNIIIEQAAGVGQWYYVDIAKIKEKDLAGQAYTTGDALLEIWNSGDANTMTAELAWECQPVEKMLHKSRTFAANEAYQHVILRSVIDNVNKDMAWIYVTTEKDMSFRVTMQDRRGQTCEDAIDYDWANGNTHPAGDTLWYKVKLDTLSTPYGIDKDLRLTVTNLTANNAAAEAVLYTACGGDSLGAVSRILPGDSALTKEISHWVIDSIIGDSLYIRLSAAENVYLHAELIGEVAPYIVDTFIIDTMCVGETYYGINGTPHLISEDSIGKMPVMWIDSVPFIYNKVQSADSVFHYEIHLRTTPEAVEVDTLNVPLYLGRAIDYQALSDSLLAYFANNAADTIAAVDATTLKWEQFDAATNAWVDAQTTKLGFDIRSIRLRYSIATACDTVGLPAGTLIELDTTYIHRDTVDSVVCAGSNIALHGVPYVIVADTTVIDTFLVVDWDATLKQDVDSIILYNFRVYKAPTLATNLTSLPVAQVGKAVDVTAATAEVKANMTAQAAADPLMVALKDTVYWQQKNGTAYAAISTDKLTSADDLTLRYGVRSDDCDTTYFSDDIVIQVALKDSAVKDIVDTICANDLYISHDYPTGRQLTAAVNTWTERFNYTASAEQDIDSIYHYTVYLYVDYAAETLAAIETQVGKVVSTAAAEAELKQKLDAQNTADGLKVHYNNVAWAVKTGTYTMGENLTSDAAITLQYTVTTTEGCSTLTGEVAVNIAAADSVVAPTIVDTVCAGATYTARLGDKAINANTTWRERVALADKTDAAQWKDSVYVYDIYVYVDYAAETIAPVEAQVGKVVSTADAEAELKQKLDAQNTADGLKVHYNNVAWAVKTGTYTMGENLTSDAAITLQYTVTTTEGCSTLTGEVAVNIAAADSVVAPAVVDTVCAGATFTARLGDKVINANTTWRERVALADKTDAAQWKDSVYVYELYVYTLPATKAVTTAPTASCGKPVDVTAATAALETAYAPAGLAAPVDSIYWEIDLGNGWTALTDEALDTRIESVQMRYKAHTICDEVITGNAVTVTVAEDCVEAIEEITDTVCVNDEYKTRLQTLTITENTEVSDTVMVTDATGNKFDSIYNYTIYVYKELVMPDQSDVTTWPEAVCGEEVRIDETIAELEALFASDKLTEPVVAITWEIDLGNGYEALTDQSLSADLKTIGLRYTVQGKCNTKQGEFLVKVEKPNSINLPNKYETMEIVEKYEGWLLMINYNKLSEKAKELGMELTEESVIWYKVNGEPDITTADPTDLPDDSVGVGYYYTEKQILNPGDQYYAVVSSEVTPTDECGGSMYTNFIVIKKGATPVSIAPTIARPGDDIYISGLNNETEYVISVFDLTGICVESHTVSDAETFTLQAQSTTGYYMVQVSPNADDVRPETFKYVVK